MCNSHTPTLRLAIFDLDGTLKAVRSPYGYVHRALGVEEEAARIHARYQRRELSYQEWGQQEIALWRGLPVAELEAMVRAIPYWPGAVGFVEQLRGAGVKIALVSAGFELHVQRCAAELKADVVFFNLLGVSDGRLTGGFVARVNSHNKGRLAQELQARFGVGRDETLVAGDTPHDISMFP